MKERSRVTMWSSRVDTTNKSNTVTTSRTGKCPHFVRPAGRQKSYRDTTLYTTLAPCAMCTGTIIQFKIPRSRKTTRTCGRTTLQRTSSNRAKGVPPGPRSAARSVRGCTEARRGPAVCGSNSPAMDRSGCFHCLPSSGRYRCEARCSRTQAFYLSLAATPLFAI
jgi:hypothetical protein